MRGWILVGALLVGMSARAGDSTVCDAGDLSGCGATLEWMTKKYRSAALLLARWACAQGDDASCAVWFAVPGVPRRQPGWTPACADGDPAVCRPKAHPAPAPAGPGVVTGRVIDPLWAPLAGVEVSTSCAAGVPAGEGPRPCRARTDGHGAFRITGLEPGLHVLDVRIDVGVVALAGTHEVDVPAGEVAVGRLKFPWTREAPAH